MNQDVFKMQFKCWARFRSHCPKGGCSLHEQASPVGKGTMQSKTRLKTTLQTGSLSGVWQLDGDTSSLAEASDFKSAFQRFFGVSLGQNKFRVYSAWGQTEAAAGAGPAPAFGLRTNCGQSEGSGARLQVRQQGWGEGNSPGCITNIGEMPCRHPQTGPQRVHAEWRTCGPQAERGSHREPWLRRELGGPSSSSSHPPLSSPSLKEGQVTGRLGVTRAGWAARRGGARRAQEWTPLGSTVDVRGGRHCDLSFR